VRYLSALDMCSRQGATQIHVYLALPSQVQTLLMLAVAIAAAYTTTTTAAAA